MRSPRCEVLIGVTAACLVVNAIRDDGDTICTHHLRPAVQWVESRVPCGELVIVGALHVGAHMFWRHLVKPLRLL